MFDSMFSIYKKKVYKHIFFDLDRTLWDFEQNMVEALKEIYFDNQLDVVFPDFTTFTNTFVKHNDRLWEQYRKGELRKEVLRFTRFDLTLKDYGLDDRYLAKKIGDDYINITPTKTALIPHARETLNYLGQKYKLHIISNGFNEVQLPKLQKCHIDHFFDKVITSEMSGYHKPCPEAFGFALSQANARKKESIIVGDDLEVDIAGAKKFGIDQVYFNPKHAKPKVKATYEIYSLPELTRIL